MSTHVASRPVPSHNAPQDDAGHLHTAYEALLHAWLEVQLHPAPAQDPAAPGRAAAACHGALVALARLRLGPSRETEEDVGPLIRTAIAEVDASGHRELLTGAQRDTLWGIGVG